MTAALCLLCLAVGYAWGRTRALRQVEKPWRPSGVIGRATEVQGFGTEKVRR